MKNIPGEKLNQAMSDLVKAFDRLFKRTKVKKKSIGFSSSDRSDS